jgi:hypothetical protein
MLDKETGELVERRLEHESGEARAFNKLLLWIPRLGIAGNGDFEHREEAEEFYRNLGAQGTSVRVGMEASGHAGWFERMLAEL